MSAAHQNGHIYTVQELTREIKTLLEERYPFLWITGEISNLAFPASGHAYFSLKDGNALISAVMFRTQRQRLPFSPENGMKITGMARISLYEPRGSYQLIFEHLAPDGTGALQKAFEQLKNRLAGEGLFDADHKKPLPFLPEKISVITSGTGAAVRDIIHVATRRFPGCGLEIVPVRVQGEGAEFEIARSLEIVNRLNRSDLIILARGGGSLEDLWAFNTETVARAVFESAIPVITGVGHETDFTIADFVADLRAPTPSAAAEIALPDRKELLGKVTGLEQDLVSGMRQRLQYLAQRLDDLAGRLKSPDRVIREFKTRVEESRIRLKNGIVQRLSRHRERLFWLGRTLAGTLPRLGMAESRQQIRGLETRLNQAMEQRLGFARSGVSELRVRLHSLSPQAVLDRGYSITRDIDTGRVVMDADAVSQDKRVEIILSKGRLTARVE